jgi:heptosyltransferase III
VKSLPIDKSRISRILVIKLRAVGDVLLSTVVTKNLREAFPTAKIAFLTESPSADIIRNNPYIDEPVIYDRSSTGSVELIRKVRRGKFDLVIDLFGNPRSALLTRLSGARHRVGFRFRGRTYAYTLIVEPRGGTVHNTQFNLDALEAIGISIVDRTVQFRFSDEDRRYVDEFLAQAGIGGLVIGLNTGGGWYTKRWPLDRFAVLGGHLIERFGARIVLPWGPGQLEEVRNVQSMMKDRGFIPPPTTLTQLGALLARCSIVVSNDSGPMHIAAAVGTPVLGIYGPTNPLLQGPYGEQHLTVRREGLDCLGCNFTKCPIGHLCMNELTIEKVLEAFEELLLKNGIAT